jgi:Helix-turn-helix domain
VIELAFDLVDAARIRFAVSPLAETIWSTVAYRKPNQRWLHRSWRDRAANQLGDTDIGLLLAMTSGRTYLPDFLTPVPDSPRPTLDQELAKLATTNPRDAAAQIRLIHPNDQPPPQLQAFADDPTAGLHRLTTQLNRYFHTALAPDWPRIRSLAEADIAHRSSLAAAHGSLALLTDLHPQLSWADGRLTLHLGTMPFEQLDDQPMILIPCAFAWPNVHTAHTINAGWLVSYPPRGVGQLWQDSPRLPPNHLAALLGPTRAAILTILDQPLTPTDVANQLNLAPSTASHHLTILRTSGLAIHTREQRSVRYLRTTLGDQLTDATAPPDAPRSSKNGH